MKAKTSSPVRRRSRRLATSLALLACAGVAYAGFDFPAGKPDACLQYDGEPLGKPGTYPQSTIDKLKKQYGIGDAAAKAKLDAIRKNIDKAKDLVEAEDKAIAKCLKDACASGRVCIDFKSPNAQASLLPDGTKACDKDKMNIGVNAAGCAEMKCWDPALYILFTNLLHEGKHMIQDYAAVGNDPVIVDVLEPLDAAARADCKEKVKKAKKSSCNEIEAEEAENKVIDAMKGPLMKIANGMPPGPLPGGAAGKLIMAVQGAPDPKKAAKDLLDTICKEKAGNDNHIACQKERKKAFDDFLASGGTAADKKKMNDAIKKTRWFTAFPGDPTWGPVTNVTTGGATGGVIHQTTGSTEQDLDTGLLRATAFHYINQTTVVIAGVDHLENGVFLLYFDEDGDALLDAGTRQELFTTSLLRGGIELTQDLATGDLLAFEAERSNVFRVSDFDGDGIPETVHGAPTTAPSANLENAYAFEISESGHELYGRYFGEDDAFADAEVLAFSDRDGDGFFETEEVLPVFANAMFATAFVGMPQDGQVQAELAAPSLAFVEVYCVDEQGRVLELLGSGQADEKGTIRLTLARPLMLGNLVAMHDLTNGMISQPVDVLPSATSTLIPAAVSISASTGGVQVLRFHGGAENAGRGYLLLGSLSGVQPGTEVRGLHLPLNWDAYTDATLHLANTGSFVNTRGTLDAQGEAICAVGFGPLSLAVAGRSLYHALVVLDGESPLRVSNPVALTVVP